MASVKLDDGILRALAQGLIEDPDKHLGHLQGWPIVYVFESGWKGDKEFDFGRVSMKSHLAAVALQGKLKEGEEVTCDNTEKCFLIEINEDYWKLLDQVDKEGAADIREQCMYGLLCGCQVDEKGNPSTGKPDIRLFTEEISVYGEAHRNVQAIMKRVKGRQAGTEGGLPFNDILLSPTEKARAQWIADGIKNPAKTRDIDGTAPGLLELASGELMLPTYWGSARIDNLAKDSAFFHAVRVSPETPEEAAGPAPELAFDKRFPVEGMRLKFSLTTDDEEKREQNRFETMRVREVGYRLLLPEVKVEQSAIPLDDQPEATTPSAEHPVSVGQEVILDTCPLRVGTSTLDSVLNGTALDKNGKGGTVFSWGGSHYVATGLNKKGQAAEALRVVIEDVWKKTNDELPFSFSSDHPDKCGMRVIDTEQEPWVIVSNCRYQVIDAMAPRHESEGAPVPVEDLEPVG